MAMINTELLSNYFVIISATILWMMLMGVFVLRAFGYNIKLQISKPR